MGEDQAWDPILIASRGTPDAVDRSAVRNVVETEDVVGCEEDIGRILR